MSITDELRAWAKEHLSRSSILAIADRIDAEHQRQLDVLYRDMSDAEWVRLPVDADGVPIHVGYRLTDGEYTFEVCELAAFKDGSWSIRNEDGNAWAACDVTHYHEPTVEDVLRGVVELCHNTWKEGSAFEFYDVDDVMKSGNIADFAAKLRLAGDAE